MSGHADTLVEHYTLEQGFYRLLAPVDSNLLGVAPEDVPLPEGLTLVGVQHADGEPGLVGQQVAADDVFVVSGDSERVTAFVTAHGLRVVATPLTRATREALLSRDAGVAEVVVPPRSPMIGDRLFPGQARSGLTVLEIRRFGHSTGPRPTDVDEGDLVLLHGP